jgi:hypothetical protein
LAERSNNKWNKDEDCLLREMHAAGKSSVRIAAALKRTTKSVRGRLGILIARERSQARKSSSEFPDSNH